MEKATSQLGLFDVVVPLPWLLVPIFLTVVFMQTQWRSVERKVQSQAQEKIKHYSFSWAEVETFNLGRNAILLGSPPNQKILNKAIRNISALPSVQRVHFLGDIASVLPPAYLQISSTKHEFIIEGQIASVDRRALLAAIDDVNKTKNYTDLQENYVEKLNVPNVFFLHLRVLPERAQVYITPNWLSFSGNISCGPATRLFYDDLQRHFSGEIINQTPCSLPPFVDF